LDSLTRKPALLLSSETANASFYIDNLLQDTWLFVMEIYSNPTQIRDEALYQRAYRQVETVRDTLKARKESDEFINHVLYAQCGLLDVTVMTTAPNRDDNIVWQRKPLQAVFVEELRAGEVLYERAKALLRQLSPDPRLLVLYQRVFGLGFGSGWGDQLERRDLREPLMESLNALVPAGELPLSAPLVVERRPTVRGTLLHSRLAHIVLALLVTGGLAVGLQMSLLHVLQMALPG
jgi:type VI secretion system protein ImpK